MMIESPSNNRVTDQLNYMGDGRLLTTNDIGLLERYGTLGIITNPPRDTRILDGTYEDARKCFYANLAHDPNWIYTFDNGVSVDAGDITVSEIEEIGAVMFRLPHVRGSE